MSRLFNYENTSPIYEGYDSETGAIMIVAEMYEDMTNVYESMAILNSVGLALEGAVDPETIVVLEAKQKEAKAGLASRFVNVLKNLLEKVKNWFKNLKDNWIKKKVSYEELIKKYIPILRSAWGDSDHLTKNKELKKFSMDMHNYYNLFRAPRKMNVNLSVANHLKKFGVTYCGGRTANINEVCSSEEIDNFKMGLLKEILSPYGGATFNKDALTNIKETSKKEYIGDIDKVDVGNFLGRIEAIVKFVHYPIDKYSSQLEKDIKECIDTTRNIKEFNEERGNEKMVAYYTCEIKLLTVAISVCLQVVDAWKEAMYSFIEDAKVFTFRALKYAKLI